MTIIVCVSYTYRNTFIGHNEGTDHGADQRAYKEQIAGAHRR